MTGTKESFTTLENTLQQSIPNCTPEQARNIAHAFREWIQDEMAMNAQGSAGAGQRQPFGTSPGSQR